MKPARRPPSTTAALSRPRHASQKIPPVDAITCGLRSVLALLHYFVFFEPVHISSICF